VGAEGDLVVPPRRYTEQQFRVALADPEIRTLADLCRALQLVPRGANYETIRAYGRTLGLDVDRELRGRRPQPRSRRSYTDGQLQQALQDPRVDGYPALCRRLGLLPHPTTHRRLDAHARELGLAVPAAWRRPGPRTDAPAHDERLYGEDELRRAVAASLSLAAAIRRLGERPSNSTYAKIHRSLHLYDVPTDHLLPDGGANRRRQRPLEDVLVHARPEHGSTLRRRLIAEGLKEHRCEHCRWTAWHGEPIPLEVDHVDGDRTNNRLGNLRLLCPNCHAQTPTYRGRNIGRPGHPLERSLPQAPLAHDPS
jgi:hypothetical protein